MKHFNILVVILTITALGLTFNASSQTPASKPVQKQTPASKPTQKEAPAAPKSIFQKEKVKAGFGVSVVQTQPEFPGGSDSLLSYLKAHIHYPMQAQEKREQGTVFVGFMVDTLGMIKDVRILGSVSDALDSEALRVVQAMPAWKPGTAGGSSINSQWVQPVEFVLPRVERED